MQNTPIVRIQPKAYWQLAVVIALFFSWFIIWENVKERHHFVTDELVYTKSLFSDVTYQIDYEREPSGNKVAYHTISTPDRCWSGWSLTRATIPRGLCCKARCSARKHQPVCTNAVRAGQHSRSFLCRSGSFLSASSKASFAPISPLCRACETAPPSHLPPAPFSRQNDRRTQTNCRRTGCFLSGWQR